MARPLSNDLRERVVARHEAGESIRSVALRFDIAPSMVSKWARRRRETGSVEPAQFGGYRRRLLEPHRERGSQPGGGEAAPAGQGAAGRTGGAGDQGERGGGSDFSARRRAELQKKTAFATELDRPDVARRRLQWQARQATIDPKRLVFIDETWTKTNMAPLRGWGPRGRRLIGKAPHGRWRTLTFLAALRHDRIDAPCLFRGPINGQKFLAYVEQFLVPTLQPRDIVIPDNLASHKSKGRTQGGPRQRRQAPLPAALQPRPQSHRTGLRQAQALAPKGAGPFHRRNPQRPRTNPRTIRAPEMRRLSRKLRIRFRLRRDRSRGVGRQSRRRSGVSSWGPGLSGRSGYLPAAALVERRAAAQNVRCRNDGGRPSVHCRSPSRKSSAVKPSGVSSYSTATGELASTRRVISPWSASWRSRSVIIFLLAPPIMRARSLKRTGPSLRCHRIDPVHLPPRMRMPRSIAQGSAQAFRTFFRPRGSRSTRALRFGSDSISGY